MEEVIKFITVDDSNGTLSWRTLWRNSSSILEMENPPCIERVT